MEQSEKNVLQPHIKTISKNFLSTRTLNLKAAILGAHWNAMTRIRYVRPPDVPSRAIHYQCHYFVQDISNPFQN